MNYIGSKLRLIKFLEESITNVVGTDCVSFCDLFAGTGVVGQHFKKLGYQVISNDLQYYLPYLHTNHPAYIQWYSDLDVWISNLRF